MRSYLKYKEQISGFGDVLETVKVTEKIAAANIHLLKQEVYQLDQYIQEINTVLERMSLFYEYKESIFLKKRKEASAKKAIIVLSSNKGLVGALYHDLTSYMMEQEDRYDKVIIIGESVAKLLEEESIAYDKVFSNISEIMTGDEVLEISDYIFNAFRSGDISSVDIIYPKFVSVSVQSPKKVEFLPFEFTDMKRDTKLLNNGLGYPIFDQKKENIFQELLKRYMSVFFHKIIIEAKLSEFSARTVAMEHASEKTEDMLKDLKLAYLKERRLMKTKSQLELFLAHNII